MLKRVGNLKNWFLLVMATICVCLVGSMSYVNAASFKPTVTSPIYYYDTYNSGYAWFKTTAITGPDGRFKVDEYKLSTNISIQSRNYTADINNYRVTVNFSGMTPAGILVNSRITNQH